MEHKFKEKNKSIWSMTTHLPPRDPLPGNLTVEAAGRDFDRLPSSKAGR